jgi:hypothetical protein
MDEPLLYFITITIVAAAFRVIRTAYIYVLNHDTVTILFYLFMRVPYHSSKFIIHTTPISFGDDDFSSRLNCTLATWKLEATLILA